MIKNFKLYEKNQNKPDVNSLSPKFWEMVRIMNWNFLIKYYTTHLFNDKFNFIEKAESRIYIKYTYDEIKQFDNEYHIFYSKLYDYFRIKICGKNINIPSDDGYSDLLSSIIGKGKTFAKKCINDVDVFIKMIIDNDYMENFGYFLHTDEDYYWFIIEKYYPTHYRVIAKKYNL